MENFLRDGEVFHDLNINGFKIIQRDDVFRFGMDAVLLADFAKPARHEKTVDLGTGQGIIPILLCAKTKVSSVIGVEIQEKLCDMAQRSVLYNDLSDRIKIINADLKKLDNILEKAYYDLIICNPPYKPLNRGLKSESFEIMAAKHEILCTLADVVKASSALLRFAGRLCLCCRPERLFDIMDTMRRHSIEPKLLRFVHGKINKAPSLLLIEGKKGVNPGLVVQPPLVIYNADQSLTDEVQSIYKGSNTDE